MNYHTVTVYTARLFIPVPVSGSEEKRSVTIGVLAYNTHVRLARSIISIVQNSLLDRASSREMVSIG